MQATIAATPQPSGTRDEKLNELYNRQRAARARLDDLRSQIGQAKKDVEAAAWAIEGYRNRTRSAQQLAGVAHV